jgi:enoyl-CoA hydratase
MATSQQRLETIRVEQRGRVGLIVLNRPQALNALSSLLATELLVALDGLETDDGVGCIVITGSERAFAAGADIREMASLTHTDVFQRDHLAQWDRVARCRKPLIAAVAGYALGGGCELAMMCDFIVADPTARFGQPELAVGIMPGAGGTQRLLRAVGRPVAAMLLLTGEQLTADRAFQLGLVAELAEEGQALERATALARKAARMPPKAVAATRRMLRQGPDLPLDAALALENREFLLLFDTPDKTEGMRAFLDKRRPEFTGK